MKILIENTMFRVAEPGQDVGGPDVEFIMDDYCIAFVNGVVYVTRGFLDVLDGAAANNKGQDS